MAAAETRPWVFSRTATPTTSSKRSGRELSVVAKDNQPGLLDQLKRLPWTNAPVAHVERDRGHKYRTPHLQVMPAPETITFLTRSRPSSSNAVNLADIERCRGWTAPSR